VPTLLDSKNRKIIEEQFPNNNGTLSQSLNDDERKQRIRDIQRRKLE